MCAEPPGSSPLARGLPVVGRPGAGGDRIIPARAGFTSRASRGVSGSRDHPRSRGVYEEQAEKAKLSEGSSPLARGLLSRASWMRLLRGIIPARAGFTPPSSPRPGRPSDHPRSRGVYEQVLRLDPSGDGSSPLARGLRWLWR